MDPANPRHDKPAIRRAINAHLKALGMPTRPIIWAEDARTGFTLMRNRRRDEAPVDAWFAAEKAAKNVASWEDCRIAPSLRWWWYAKEAVTPLPMRDGPWEAAGRATDSIAVISSVAAYAHHPEIERIVAIKMPLVTAFEAGLFLYWITPADVVCVLQPTLSLEEERLHKVDGPAVTWPSGEAYCFWRGIHVPSWFIDQPDRLIEASVGVDDNYDLLFQGIPIARFDAALPGSPGQYRYAKYMNLIYPEVFKNVQERKAPRCFYIHKGFRVSFTITARSKHNTFTLGDFEIAPEPPPTPDTSPNLLRWWVHALKGKSSD